MTEEEDLYDNETRRESWNETTGFLVTSASTLIESYMNDTTDPLLKTRRFYLYIGSVFIALCITAFIINLFILLSAASWIRRPISATLQISLSMTTADSCTLLLNVNAVIINSLMPNLQGTVPFKECSRLLMEAVRYGVYNTTFFHVFALAGNHYLGIKRPFKYSQIMTHRTVHTLLLLLWTLPTAIFIFAFYFLVDQDQGFRSPECKSDFIAKRYFRHTYSLVVSIFIVLIIIIYTHIYVMVRSHQTRQPVYGTTRSDGGGSTVIGSRPASGSTHGHGHSHNHYYSTTHHSNRKESSMTNRTSMVGGDREGNTNHRERRRRCACPKPPIKNKTIITTILIVGSLVVGWTPAVMYFAIVCDDGCFLQRQTYTSWEGNMLISSFCNYLLILKTALNSYIYAARMQETKDALRRMKIRCLMRCRRRTAADDMSMMGLPFDTSLMRRSTRISRCSSSRRTVVCHLQDSNSQDQPLINGETLSPRGGSVRAQTNSIIRSRIPRDDTPL